MPRARKWGVESLNRNKSTDSLEPLSAPVLTAGEVRRKRIELCEEMLGLLLGDDGLTAKPRQALQRIHASLGTVRRQL